jgi:serine/threonine protein kinase
MMELAQGGELFKYILAKGRVKEARARYVFFYGHHKHSGIALTVAPQRAHWFVARIIRKFFQQVVSAVNYCHEKNIIHRDIKHKNILLDKDLNVKLIDFGLSNFTIEGGLRSTFCGTPAYSAPEMVCLLPLPHTASDLVVDRQCRFHLRPTNRFSHKNTSVLKSISGAWALCCTRCSPVNFHSKPSAISSLVHLLIRTLLHLVSTALSMVASSFPPLFRFGLFGSVGINRMQFVVHIATVRERERERESARARE